VTKPYRQAQRDTRRAPRDGSNLAAAIEAYMSARSISTIGDMAAILGVDRTLVSKYLTGTRQCHDVAQLRHFAEAMDLPPETFGLVTSPEDPPTGRGLATPEAHQWRLVRQTLNRNRSELTSIAARLYWDPVRIAGTTCITLPEWMPPRPVPLDRIELEWLAEADPPMISGAEKLSVACRPHGPTGDRYARYSQAIRGLASPALFENRVSYRLLELDWTPGGGRMAFGHTTYFDMLDVCEVLAHETAAASLRGGPSRRLALDDLPFRSYVGDLFDLARRPVLPSVNTLTIRRGPEGDSFFLHRRGAARVTLAAGQTHVIPAGVFQPSGIAPWNMAGDFDLWRNILRELSEELLGNPEHDGSSGGPIDYVGEEPFRTLNEGVRSGAVRSWCLGVGLDPLAPAGEILTVVTIDADVFDRAFAGMVSTNAEGEIVASEPGIVGSSWTLPNIQRFMRDEPLACAAAACIGLTWKHRDLILGN
jgi:hypothetical protein